MKCCWIVEFVFSIVKYNPCGKTGRSYLYNIFTRCVYGTCLSSVLTKSLSYRENESHGSSCAIYRDASELQRDILKRLFSYIRKYGSAPLIWEVTITPRKSDEKSPYSNLEKPIPLCIHIDIYSCTYHGMEKVFWLSGKTWLCSFHGDAGIIVTCLKKAGADLCLHHAIMSVKSKDDTTYYISDMSGNCFLL